MDTLASTIAYRPLKQKHEIRLLHLQPGQFNQDIKCTLHHVNLGHRPKPVYMALSYVWGNPAVTAPILCNDTYVPVTLSLANALRRLRKPEGSVIVWADALCINQGDIAERSSQVGIMAEIYKNAGQVVVYLGEDTEDTPKVFALLRRVLLLIRSEPDPDRLLEAFLRGYKDGNSPIIPPCHDPHWAALVNLYRRDYFARIWVVQEVALAQTEPRVICGRHQAWWSEIMGVAHLCSGPSNAVLNNAAMKSNSDCASYMDQARNAILSGSMGKYAQSLKLIRLLQCTSRSRATDPRDKLFALYGLANDINGPDGRLLKADYAMTLREVLVSVMDFFISKEQGFVALAFAGLRDDDRTGAIPSWVPNWIIPVTNPLDSGRGAAGYNASGGRRGRVKIAANGTILKLFPGVKAVGKVKSVFPLHKDHHITCIPEFRQPGVLLSLWTDIVAPLGTDYCLGGSVFEAFWRTLIANKDGTALPASPQFERHFVDFWVENRMADVKAEALGRTSKSPHVSDAEREKHYPKARQRLIASQASKLDRIHEIRDDTFVEKFFHEPMAEAHAHEYVQSIGLTVTNRSFIVTEEGAVGLAPGMTRVGDVVMVIAGANTPFVLRPLPEEMQRFALVGEAYVHGVMNGEAVVLDGIKREPRWTKIVLV